MNESNRDSMLDDLEPVADLLRRHRPSATPLELDRIQQRAVSQLSRGRPGTKGSFLKTRLAITSVLALGLLMAGSGATLAVSGSSESGSAAKSQYPDSVAPRDSGDGGLAGEERAAPVAAQPTEQVSASSGSSLPFTGLAAIPILLGGIALMAAGLVLHRSSRRSRPD